MKNVRHFFLSAIRRILKEVDIRIERQRNGIQRLDYPTNGREAAIEELLRSVARNSDEDHSYLESHIPRLTRTFSLTPVNGGRALELGSYGYTAAVLQRVLGYSMVRGAYYGPNPGHELKTVRTRGQEDFTLEIDLFDAERHVYPYEDGSFDVVLCCELIEHLLVDPMHLLFECHRVLTEGGLLLVTTPNIASFSSIACLLHGWKNPQIYSAYSPSDGNAPHVREYTARELADAVTAAGFEIEALFTERIGGFDEGAWVESLLEREGFDTNLRGEQTYCLARRRGSAVRERYPKWLYSS